MHERMEFPWTVEERRPDVEGHAKEMAGLLQEAYGLLRVDEYCEASQELAERIERALKKAGVAC